VKYQEGNSKERKKGKFREEMCAWRAPVINENENGNEKEMK
jgi:hypothetical protein